LLSDEIKGVRGSVRAGLRRFGEVKTIENAGPEGNVIQGSNERYNRHIDTVL
jgi:hypothetical protein